MTARFSGRRSGAGGSSGLALIELMISLVLGMVIVAAVLINYLGSVASGRFLAALAQMTEDAQLAMSLLGNDIRMAGASDVTGVTTSAQGVVSFNRAVTIRPVFGCEYGFDNVTAPILNANCNALSAIVNAIEVNYQASAATTVGQKGVPTDCQGETLSRLNAYGNNYIASNRYYVAMSSANVPELYCGSPGNSPQPIATNVSEMQLMYGFAPNWQLGSAASRRPQAYVHARALTTGDWDNNVVSVRICLLMRSAEPVLTSEDPQQYRDCSGTLQTSPDRRLYRAFFSTVALRNRVAF